MDLFAGLFGFTLVVLSIGITYHWGIKPDREAKQRRAKRVLAEERRQREQLRDRARRRATPVSNTQSGAHL